LLQERGILPDKLLDKLRSKVFQSDPPMSAEALAKFLVQKGHLSAAQATNQLRLLNAQPAQLSAAHVDQGAEDEPGSSIFPQGPPAAKPRSQHPNNLDDDEVLELVPIDDEEDVPRESRSEDRGEPVYSESASAFAPMGRIEEPPPEPRTLPRESPLGPPLANSTARAQPAAGERLASRDGERVKKRQRRKNQWDSPLLLIGGGLLAVLVLCGAVVALILNWENGDDQLKQARAAAGNGAYAQAITYYDAFLAKFPRHPEWSKARVQLAMVRLHSDVDSHDYEAALKTAQDQLPAIENEPKFSEAHGELATLLPQIARGLADQAEKSIDKPDDATRYAKAATDTLALCAESKYVPKALRNESELDGVEETLARVNRRQQSQHDLEETLHSMQAAVEKGDFQSSYAAYRQVLQNHPELTADDSLKSTLANTSQAEQAAVKFVRDEHPADTIERPTPWLAAIAVADRHGTETAPAAGTFCPWVDGAIYGIDVSSGQVLWRRYVGTGVSAPPAVIGDDLLVIDSRFQELMRLDARTGHLIWRQALDGPFSAPVVAGNHIYVAAESGRLFVVDPKSGARAGYFQFGQPLRAPPVADRLGERLYLAGDQSTLYSISLKDQQCLGAYYLGHPAGSISLSPALVLDKLVVLENDGVATSHLHLLALDSKSGSIAKPVTDRRLTGLAASPPLATGRRIVAATDRGELDVFEVGAGDGDKALAQVATHAATEKQSLVRFVALTEGAIWVADTRLTKFGVLPTGDRLPVQTLDNDFAGATFDNPLGVFGGTLLSVRRAPGRAGAIVAATDADHGHAYWETELAVPPAANPVVSDADRAFATANVNGVVFAIDEAAIRARVANQPLSGAGASASASLTTGVELGGGRAVFAAPGKSDYMLSYDASQRDHAVSWSRLPSNLSCRPTPLAGGIIVPLEVGQVFFLNPANGQSLAAPFQPRLQPGAKLAYQPAGVAVDDPNQFVITDGREKIYLVALADQPQPHMTQVAEANVGPFPIVSPIVVNKGIAAGISQGGHLVRFQLPSLSPAGETNLSADGVAGPFALGDLLVVATANQQLVAVKPDGSIAWSAPLEKSDLAGAPVSTEQGFLIAYRNGFLELRNPSDGQPIRKVDLKHPLATSPVRYMNRIVVAAPDGTLLIANQP
jgi:outer membrane protein assembly factor BamB